MASDAASCPSLASCLAATLFLPKWELFIEQEDANMHSENALMLATMFGTGAEVQAVRAAIAYRDRNRGYHMCSPEYATITDILIRYYDDLYKAAHPEQVTEVIQGDVSDDE